MWATAQFNWLQLPLCCHKVSAVDHRGVWGAAHKRTGRPELSYTEITTAAGGLDALGFALAGDRFHSSLYLVLIAQVAVSRWSHIVVQLVDERHAGWDI